MATGDFDAEAAPKHTDFDPSEANLLRAKIGLDKGVHFRYKHSDEAVGIERMAQMNESS